MGSKMMNGIQSNVAIVLGMFATEQYPLFKEAIETHFSKPEALRWGLEDDYPLLITNHKENIIRIWQKIEDYAHVSLLMRMKWWFIDWSYFTYLTFFIGSIIEIVYFIRDDNLW